MGGLKGCCKRSKRRASDDSESLDSEPTKRKWPLWKKIVVWSCVTLLALVLLAFILIWIVVPVTFWLSYAFERFMVFIPINNPRNPDFNNPSRYEIDGVLNFYIAVADYQKNNSITKIGAWLILPEDDVGKVTIDDIPTIIKETKYDVLIYLHGVYANRAKPIWQYGVLRKEFLVIAVDHRGYGDSGENVEMTEVNIINDYLQIYDWLIDKDFKNYIYYWGHSLGTALSCHTVKALKEERNFVPKGLVLEAAFTTYAEEVEKSIVGKIFKWLVYFEATVLIPLDYNGFHFHSSTNVLDIDCPIMILHAEDDNVIPSLLGEKLAEIAATQRDVRKQGNVTLHLFPEYLGYGHNDITRDVNVPLYIKNFKAICQDFTPS